MKRSILALGWLIFLSVSGWAGTQTSNGFLYKPDVGARGTAEKNLYDAGLDRVDARLGKEIWLGDPGGTPGYDTLPHALTTIGSNNVTLRVPAGTHSDNGTIPANVTLKVERGALFTGALAINGPIEAGDYQIFSGTGAVVLSGLHPIKSIWFGDNAAGINKAIMAAPLAPGGGSHNVVPCQVILPGKNITLEVPVVISGRSIDLVGQGDYEFDAYPYGGTVLQWFGSGAGIQLSTFGGMSNTNISLRNFAIVGNVYGQANTGQNGIYVGDDQNHVNNYLYMDRVTVRGFTGAGIDWRGAQYAKLHRVKSCYNGGPGLSVGVGYTANLEIDSSSFCYNAQQGIYINPGATAGSVFGACSLQNTDIQGNGYEGIDLESSRAFAVKNFSLNPPCWIEGNNTAMAPFNYAQHAGPDGGYYDIVLNGSAYQRIGTVNFKGVEWGTVQNILGAELVSNGAFATSTGWTSPNWTYDSGNQRMVADGSHSDALTPSTPITVAAGSYYLVRYQVAARNHGFVWPVLGGRRGPVRFAANTYYETIYATSTGNLEFDRTTDFDGAIDNVSVKLIQHRALFATGVDRINCQGNQWENSEAYGTQCIYGAVSNSDFYGVLSMDDPMQLWEWNEAVKVISKLHGHRELYNVASTTASSVVIGNANVPRRSWTKASYGADTPRYDNGGGSGQVLRIEAHGTKTGTNSKTINLTFGGQTITTLTSSNANAWRVEAEVTYKYQSGGVGFFLYSYKTFDGATVAQGNGTLSGGTGVNVYESIPLQIVATGGGDTVACALLKYERE